MRVTLALRSLRQEDHDFEPSLGCCVTSYIQASLDYITRPCLTETKFLYPQGQCLVWLLHFPVCLVLSGLPSLLCLSVMMYTDDQWILWHFSQLCPAPSVPAMVRHSSHQTYSFLRLLGQGKITNFPIPVPQKCSLCHTNLKDPVTMVRAEFKSCPCFSVFLSGSASSCKMSPT